MQCVHCTCFVQEQALQAVCEELRACVRGPEGLNDSLLRRALGALYPPRKAGAKAGDLWDSAAGESSSSAGGSSSARGSSSAGETSTAGASSSARGTSTAGASSSDAGGSSSSAGVSSSNVDTNTPTAKVMQSALFMYLKGDSFQREQMLLVEKLSMLALMAFLQGPELANRGEPQETQVEKLELDAVGVVSDLEDGKKIEKLYLAEAKTSSASEYCSAVSCNSISITELRIYHLGVYRTTAGLRFISRAHMHGW